MVAGRLQEKNGYYYMVLSYTGADGKRKQPWHATGLPVKGNKKRAEEMLRELRRSFTPPKPNRKEELNPDMLFSDYMLYWLKIIHPAVQETTWSSYNFNVKNHIVPYFEPTGITLGGLQARHIQSFYLHELETLKATSVLRQHANLHKALKYAVKLDLIPGNPVDKVERPKPEKYLAAYYTAEEMEQLFEAARGAPAGTDHPVCGLLRAAPGRGAGPAVGRRGLRGRYPDHPPLRDQHQPGGQTHPGGG